MAHLLFFCYRAILINLFLSTRNAINPQIQAILDSVDGTMTNYPLENCGEFNAINNALNNGVDINALRVYSTDRVGVKYKASCINCQNLYGNIVHFTEEKTMEKVNILLEQAGYSEERNIDISAILHMYEECGYHYNAKQKQFIGKYACLEIHYIHPIWKQDMLLRLNPIEAQKEITMDVVEEYNEFLQDDLLIIGDIEKENLTLFLSAKGFYFTGYDDCLINWGNNFEIMLNKLISGEKGELQIVE